MIQFLIKLNKSFILYKYDGSSEIKYLDKGVENSYLNIPCIEVSSGLTYGKYKINEYVDYDIVGIIDDYVIYVPGYSLDDIWLNEIRVSKIHNQKHIMLNYTNTNLNFIEKL